ncbi:hypothetical protein [Nostoc sp. 'Peltigera membranacea cyanobiont' N6]|uniref:hypothetical protein n=1 Tax=Nostoc sp. 'Peltigera membranacea cyanobiont' N6 TaxID=1261031 RepID=UPI0011AFE148|nr:hypothetical protein [Nostoc sp. 'Peltigera membranacea cyanobiont' N6]
MIYTFCTRVDKHRQAAITLADITRFQARSLSMIGDKPTAWLRLPQQAGDIDLDQRETRRLIDAQLRAAGWEIDSQQLTYLVQTEIMLRNSLNKYF